MPVLPRRQPSRPPSGSTHRGGCCLPFRSPLLFGHLLFAICKGIPCRVDAGNMNRKALTDQAIALQRSGRLDEAERLYLEVLAHDPQDFTARHLLGVTRAQSGRIDEALA